MKEWNYTLKVQTIKTLFSLLCADILSIKDIVNNYLFSILFLFFFFATDLFLSQEPYFVHSLSFLLIGWDAEYIRYI